MYKQAYSPLSEVADEVAVFPLVNEVVVCQGWGWLKLCVPVFTIVLLVGGAVIAVVVVVVVGVALGGAIEVDVDVEEESWEGKLKETLDWSTAVESSNSEKGFWMGKKLDTIYLPAGGNNVSRLSICRISSKERDTTAKVLKTHKSHQSHPLLTSFISSRGYGLNACIKQCYIIIMYARSCDMRVDHVLHSLTCGLGLDLFAASLFAA